MSAFVGNVKALFQKLFCFSAVCHCLERHQIYIAEPVFVQTLKVARIDVAVRLHDKLVRAMPAESALLGSVALCHLHPIVKASDARVIALDIISDVTVKSDNEETSILLRRKVKRIFRSVAEGAQARYVLNILVSF